MRIKDLGGFCPPRRVLRIWWLKRCVVSSAPSEASGREKQQLRTVVPFNPRRLAFEIEIYLRKFSELFQSNFVDQNF